MPQVVDIVLFPEQAGFVADQSPFSAAVAGVGSGKSRAGAVKALQYVVSHPGSLGMVTAPTFPMLRDATLRTIMEVWPKALTGDFRAGEMRLVVPNGSEVLFRSTDDPEHLRGPNLAWVWMDEGARSSQEAFKVLQGRLRQTGYPAQLWMTTTPWGFNWVYQEFVAQKRASYRLFRWSSRANYFLPKEFIKNLEESYSKEFALQEIEGEFTLTGGNSFFNAEALKGMLDNEMRVPLVSKGGLIRTWRPPVVGGRYIAGFDTAWGKTGSYSCLVILDWRSGYLVAAMHGRPDLDELALEAVGLLTRYNRAYVVAEWAGDEDEGQYVVQKMVSLGYGDRMYYRDTDGKRQKPGWVTDGVSRPLMLAEHEEAVRKGQVVIPWKEAIMEHMSFVRDEKGRPGAAEGTHDDTVMALALAGQARKYGVAEEVEMVPVRYAKPMRGLAGSIREMVKVRRFR